MRDSNALTEALVKSMEHEVYEAEKATQMQAQYVFSDAFEASMKKLIEHQRKGEISGDLQVYMPSSGASIDGQADDTEIPEYRTVIFMGRRIRLAAATAIIAALIFAIYNGGSGHKAGNILQDKRIDRILRYHTASGGSP